MMKKLLFISNYVGKGIGSFSRSSIEAAHQLGMEFHFAGNFSQTSPERRSEDEIKYSIKTHHIDCNRSPFSKSNVVALKQLTGLLQREGYDAIHCNTPVGGLLGRLAGKHCGVRPVIYMAHGFHFYGGQRLPDYMLYKSVERGLAHYTDALITINEEDCRAASRFRLRSGGPVFKVHGVGIDLSRYDGVPSDREGIRVGLGVPADAVACVCVGDLIDRKNLSTAIKAVARVQGLHLIVVGDGPQKAMLEGLAAELGISGRLHLTGYRSDVPSILKASDVFLFPSRQEGLPRAVMEAMACGLPCVLSRIRGNVDLLEEGEGGYLCAPDAVGEFIDALRCLVDNPELGRAMGERNATAVRRFELGAVVREIKEIYSNIILDGAHE